VRARIEPLSGREEFLAAQRQATTTHLITIRHSSLISALDASWRIAFGARVFTIDNIRNVDERSREMDLLCTEGKRRE
jgi:SPP1 family predicted phage head-tail adaptor